MIVKRDDEAGYIIINKPPNVPVHARVDNLLENVASCVGRMLWMERRGGFNSTSSSSLSSDEGSSVEIDNGNPRVGDGGSMSRTADDDGRRRGRRRVNQVKRKVEPLVYVGAPPSDWIRTRRAFSWWRQRSRSVLQRGAP